MELNDHKSKFAHTSYLEPTLAQFVSTVPTQDHRMRDRHAAEKNTETAAQPSYQTWARKKRIEKLQIVSTY